MSSSHWFIAIAISLTLLSSCSSTATNDKLIAQMDSTLAQANIAIKRSNNSLLESLIGKLWEPTTREKTAMWLPKAKHIDSLSTALLTYLDSFKTTVRSNSNAWKEQADEILPRLIAFKKEVLPVHERMRDVPAFSNDFSSSAATIKLFQTASPSEGIALLTSIQQQVLQATNASLLLCHEQIRSLAHYDSFEAIVCQNAKVLRAGDSLEITTGVGAFDRMRDSEITIGGQRVEKNHHGVAVYKLKTSAKRGNYSLPVSLSFIDADGKRQERTFNVEYRLVKY